MGGRGLPTHTPTMETPMYIGLGTLVLIIILILIFT